MHSDICYFHNLGDLHNVLHEFHTDIYVNKITINVEEMVREVQPNDGTFNRATKSLKPKASLSAIHLYPALAMSYCTQHNTVGKLETSSSQVTCLLTESVVYVF